MSGEDHKLCVAAWLRGCVAAWLRGCVAAWLRGCVAAPPLFERQIKSQACLSCFVVSNDDFHLSGT
jgi:hypothetical protein